MPGGWRRAAGALALLTAAATGITGCSGAGGSTPVATTGPRPTPDLKAFLALPVATPSACPSGQRGSTSGRRSPWVGAVDVSVFVDDMPARARAALGARLRGLDEVARVYAESKAEAYGEFQRLYTCSAQVKPGALPASYRLVLHHMTRGQRDALVQTIYGLRGVSSVSCDPSSPCVNIRPSPGNS